MFTLIAALHQQHFSTGRWHKYEYSHKHCKCVAVSCVLKADTTLRLKERGIPCSFLILPHFSLLWDSFSFFLFVCLPHKLPSSCKADQRVDGLHGILQIYKAVFTNWERRYSLKQINIMWWHIISEWAFPNAPSNLLKMINLSFFLFLDPIRSLFPPTGNKMH